MIPNFPLFLNSAAFIPLSTLTLEPSSGSFKPQPVRNTMYTGVMSYVHVGRVPLCTSAGQRTASPSPFSHSNMAFLWTQTMSLGGKRPYLTGRRHVCLKLIVNYLGGGGTPHFSTCRNHLCHFVKTKGATYQGTHPEV